MGDRAERAARRAQELAPSEGVRAFLAGRDLTGVAWQAMNQGDLIRCSWAGGSATGTVEAAVGDLVVVQTDKGVTAVVVPALGSIATVARRAGPGTVGDRSIESFLAWLRMAEGSTVSASQLGGEQFTGELVVVAADHVLIRDRSGIETALARSAIAAVSGPVDPWGVCYQ